ncbi:MAG: FHA domain-containing protein [Deltaproteobacteria bacterium]|nr:FHA domain-containing protein [Deltaproteobacteria bacterium]
MAVPAKTVTEESSSPYAVNKALFDEATSVKDKMKLIEGRLQKMEEHRSEVSDSVYLKVKTDYEVQIDEVREQFEGKCREIEGELKHLYQAQSEQDASLSKHQEILEEAKFRHKLGEYNDKKFKDIESQQNKEIKKYNDLLETIKASIKQYEDILGRAFDAHTAPAYEKPASPVKKVEAAPPPPAAAPPPPVQAKAPPAAAPAPVKDEDTLKTKNPPVEDFVEAPLPSLAKEEAPSAESEQAFEAKLSDELDMFLETEGDYFSQEPEEAPAAPQPTPSVPSPAAAKPEPAQPSAVSKTKPVEDSISTILRDIPLEDEGGEAVTQGPAEETGSNIDVREIPAEASLLLIEGDLDESEFILGENTSIGRSPSNDICLKESKVSRQHAAINFRNGHYVMIDLKSSNGILVNGRKVEEAYLQDGDIVTVGSFKFQFNLA